MLQGSQTFYCNYIVYQTIEKMHKQYQRNAMNKIKRTRRQNFSFKLEKLFNNLPQVTESKANIQLTKQDLTYKPKPE